MKKNLIVIFLISLGINAFSQPAVKAWAYEQDSLPGTASNGNGKGIKKAAGKNYLVFFSQIKNAKITPVQIFIKGIEYRVKIENKKTPVEIVNNNLPAKPVKTELVPRTINQVVQLKTGELIAGKKTTALEKLSA